MNSRGADDADEERHPRAGHQPGQQVAPQVVGAQRMRPQLDAVAGAEQAGVLHQAHGLGFLGGDDSLHRQLQAMHGARHLPLGVQCRHAVVVGAGLEIQAVLEMPLV